MKITVLGTGCCKCKTLYNTVLEVAKELNLDVEIEKQEDMEEIMKFNVMTLPALVIDGNVAAKGAMTPAQVREVIQNQLSK